MLQRILYFFSKIPEWVVWLIFMTILTAAAEIVLQDLKLLGLFYLPLLLFLGALTKSPRMTGLFVARRGALAILSVVIGLALSIALVHWYSEPTGGGLQGQSTNASQQRYEEDSVAAESAKSDSVYSRSLLSPIVVVFLVQGAIIGALLRNIISRLLTLTLLGRKRLGQHILLGAVWTAGIMIFPWEGHKEVAPLYVSGIAAGVFISRSFRLRLVKTIQAFKRIHEVFDAWPRTAKTSAAELEALKLLARGRQLPFLRFTRLRKKLENWRGTPEFTNRIALISSALFRIEGNHQGAIVEADQAERPLTNLEDVHLLLLKALSLLELEGEAEADAILNEISATEPGQVCPLATATLALRAAEALVEDPQAVRVSNDPLEKILQALWLRRAILAARSERGDSSDDVINNFVVRYTEIGIPLTAPYMLDIVGLCMMAAGFPEEGRIFLQRCIEIDRSYSSAYLHLGDYFLLRGHLREISGNAKEKHETWHARACYYAVRALERKTGHVRRRATHRLEQIEKRLSAEEGRA